MAPAPVEAPRFFEWRPGVRTRMHMSRSTGAESICILEQLCEPGAGAPWHRHDGVEEVLIVVEGRGRFRVAETELDVEAGGSVRIPPGCRHAFANSGDTTLRLIAAFPSATPRVEYEDEPGVLVIGVESGRHRTPLEASAT